MQPSNRYSIFASVSPNGADQNLSYRSSNEKIATVSASGTITALSPGRSSIIISNYDSIKTITVIINDGFASSYVMNEADTQNMTQNQSQSGLLIALIQETNYDESIAVNGSEYAYITTDILRALYQTSKSISVFYDDYIIRIHGKNIKNAENVLATNISLLATDAGLSFVINEKMNLPGSIEIEFLHLNSDYSYLYLFNDKTKKYEMLNSLNGTTAEVSLSGEYVLSKLKLDGTPTLTYIIVGIAVLIGLCVILYIIIRKKYIFW